ncbi:MAG TPA: DUF2975 domain-containing protein [Rhizomicrobium sp.]|nr:DUF2975 domain-containing protein [Rhizomicrobium sp.]
MATPVPENLAGLSRIMAWLSTAGFLIYPAVTVAIFLLPGSSTDWLMFHQDDLGPLLAKKVPLIFRLGALAFEMGAVACVMWALWSLRRLFLRYAAGDVFSNQTLHLLHSVAVALFAKVIVGFAVMAPVTALLTYPLGHGHRFISLSFGSEDVSALFLAGAVLVIARVMSVARRMADENESFV